MGSGELLDLEIREARPLHSSVAGFPSSYNIYSLSVNVPKQDLQHPIESAIPFGTIIHLFIGRFLSLVSLTSYVDCETGHLTGHLTGHINVHSLDFPGSISDPRSTEYRGPSSSFPPGCSPAAS